jgi:hypothetical protein
MADRTMDLRYGGRMMMATDAGIRPEGALTLRVPAPAAIRERAARMAHYRGLLEEASSLPGLSAVGPVTPLPLAGVDVNATFRRRGGQYGRESGNW